MKYHVTARKEGCTWLADVTNLAGAHTYARTLTRLDHNVREVIALIEDLPDAAEDTLELDWTFTDAPEEVLAALELGHRRAKAQAAMSAVEEATRQSVKTLSQAGFSQRDQSLLLGITPGRVGQLAHL